ncbi:hypothetical protein FNF27_00769 [Cafeteria roenbergensis]|uniref:PWWP domain-containing protein n=1 Tax=Cafeteria roenbergensis TaxID=33653 RepID=A0A5A8EJ18_CAFRO|nr:hypothetical protein FNF27_00769 [Cafeteria roenbergensis]
MAAAGTGDGPPSAPGSAPQGPEAYDIGWARFRGFPGWWPVVVMDPIDVEGGARANFEASTIAPSERLLVVSLDDALEQGKPSFGVLNASKSFVPFEEMDATTACRCWSAGAATAAQVRKLLASVGGAAGAAGIKAKKGKQLAAGVQAEVARGYGRAVEEFKKDRADRIAWVFPERGADDADSSGSESGSEGGGGDAAGGPAAESRAAEAAPTKAGARARRGAAVKGGAARAPAKPGSKARREATAASRVGRAAKRARAAKDAASDRSEDEGEDEDEDEDEVEAQEPSPVESAPKRAKRGARGRAGNSKSAAVPDSESESGSDSESGADSDSKSEPDDNLSAETLALDAKAVAADPGVQRVITARLALEEVLRAAKKKGLSSIHDDSPLASDVVAVFRSLNTAACAS